jgi:hypothetical protein
MNLLVREGIALNQVASSDGVGVSGRVSYGAPDREDGLQIAEANMFAYNPLTHWYYHGDR